MNNPKRKASAAAAATAATPQASATPPRAPSAPALRHFAQLHITVADIVDVGHTGHGQRRVVPITGGVCTTADWQARVLPLGADFQWLPTDRVSHLDARYVLETEAGERIFVHNTALRVAEPAVMARVMQGLPVAPDEVYFRCVPRFEAHAPALRWLMERVFIGTGLRRPTGVELQIFEVM
jgi:Protein of unknown function (DUF3237)